MAQPHVLEGTWEEIKLRDEELAGRFLRVIVEPSKEQAQAVNENGHLSPQPEKERVAHIKSLRGKYAHLGVSVDDLHNERATDTAREEASLRGEGE